MTRTVFVPHCLRLSLALVIEVRRQIGKSIGILRFALAEPGKEWEVPGEWISEQRNMNALLTPNIRAKETVAHMMVLLCPRVREFFTDAGLYKSLVRRGFKSSQPILCKINLRTKTCNHEPQKPSTLAIRFAGCIMGTASIHTILE